MLIISAIDNEKNRWMRNAKKKKKKKKKKKESELYESNNVVEYRFLKIWDLLSFQLTWKRS